MVYVMRPHYHPLFFRGGGPDDPTFLSMCHFGPVGETEAHVLSRVIPAPSIDRRCRKPADEYDRCTVQARRPTYVAHVATRRHRK